MKVDGTEASPMKAVSQELDTLKVLLREALAAYTSRLEEDISLIQAKVNVPEKKVSSAKIRDLRDMLTLLRRSPIKPDKARRKDLKKIESLIEDLQMLSENWN